MTEPASPYAPPSPYPVTAQQSRRRPMALRHLASALLALAAAPVGILVLDYGAGEYLRERLVRLDSSGGGAELAIMFAGALVLMLVAALSRLSGLGPILAGIVWGAFPMLWFLIDQESLFEFSQDLPSTHFWFADPPLLFVPIAALLVGAGVGGRWRGRLVPASEAEEQTSWQYRP